MNRRKSIAVACAAMMAAALGTLTISGVASAAEVGIHVIHKADDSSIGGPLGDLLDLLNLFDL